MSRKNTVKIITATSESSGYHFKSSEDDSSYVIASKHGLCNLSDDCTTNCCKSCDVTIDISMLTLYKSNNDRLTPQKIYRFPNNDIAIIQVLEKSFTPLKLGKLEDNLGNFFAFGYKAEKHTPLRLLLNSPEINGDECYFNIEGNSTPELIEKSLDYNGISGSLVIGRDSIDIPTAYSIITTNEENNDLSGDILYDIDFNELHDFFGTRVFSKQRSKLTFDTSFKNNFKKVDSIQVSQYLTVSILVPAERGFPYFNLNPIARALTNELGVVLGHKDKALNKTVLTASALQVLRDQKDKQPVYKLLSSRVAESMMNAPHIYSTYIDHSHYHHVHLLNDSDTGFELMVSSFGGEGDLTDKLNSALEQIIKNINNYSFNSKLISERAFLDMKYSHEECEFLYEILFGEQKEFINNLAMLHCIDLQLITISTLKPIEEQIKSLVEIAIYNIDSATLNSISHGLNISLYIIPMNKSNELAGLVEEILA
ncbi:DUF1837 domain-containing protein [Aeromonas veronii]|uniref:DUF1837 domain-containing protein n=1 Tax=Aeromonas veronii TaxID=654 RepID=UPI001F1DE12B|nr:DUF1837 domain-containing protein [Aeromonas veronii]MCF5888656.1 DUF1837 domain-containing protein [Aeromonas veronii]